MYTHWFYAGSLYNQKRDGSKFIWFIDREAKTFFKKKLGGDEIFFEKKGGEDFF